MSTILITGANRGIGLEFVKQYLGDGDKVIATCREPSKAQGLSALSGSLDVLSLDVTDIVRIREVARTLRKTAIDVLINNAGVYGPRPAPFGSIDLDDWVETVRINAMAPLKICEAFVEHIGSSKQRKIIAISSKMGSQGDNTSGGSYIYRSSKAALNAVMRSLAVDLEGRKISVAMLHPGWVRTDMGGASAAIDAEQSVRAMREVIAGLTLASSGRFYNYDGTEIPW
ncbi:SDR family oxidoreductase [Varunaivibrio sulfuroxidans]|uniref:Short-subunit dehydrogenase n=1 Tax=Varunaivibrio sulfuroxidans TaxID=1773489 RepID=A0A4R3JAK2_9PROT|nr:SDR family oxidoreductase [Varunaivibrio sulfuroxidans]TCS62096.1 short-subunit dehydrogenase [Varunaivibrio sulfuroxidans]WES30529.1 SDR family oxidoreductase [Varunaivibrio sulfuroxidans]